MTAQDIRFFQTFTYVLAALVGFTIFIYILAKIVDGNTQDQWISTEPARLSAIEARTAPVGSVAMAGDAVTVTPTASAALTFRDPPAAHGDDSHGEDAAGEHHEEMVEEHHEEEAPTQVAEATETTAEPAADEAAGTEAPAVADSGIDGAAIYSQGCNACHAAGVAGAPMLGDAAAWTARIAQGNDTLYAHAINGWNAMPAKGGFSYLSDDQVKAAVDYMVAESQ